MIISRAGAAISVLLLSADYLSKEKAAEQFANLKIPRLFLSLRTKKCPDSASGDVLL